MCFANAVLQVLVYCAPFAQLFMRLRSLLGEGERGAAMVRATGDFLLEFVADEKASKSGNGNGGGNGKGKGKERAQAEEEEADPEEAFIPTNVYDALKDKKRFDHMRVRFFLLHRWHV
jgi:ubiquitin carboxyl-terminal hydrolase 10